MPSPAPRSELVTADPDRAVRALVAGGLVGLPTETVYGLAADAEDPRAVARIYAVKGRPADHPLIVHLHAAGDLDAWARDVPGYARRLAEELWPGPLTLVLARSGRAGDHVTGGQDTVALRVPAHPLAHRVLAGLAGARPGAGVAAPSANRFGRVSPTTAEHVLDELDGLLVPGLDVVLDGGGSDVGVESTIVDCTGPAPVLVRPGAVDGDQLARVGGTPLAARPTAVRAPGTLASHYAPRARVLVVDATAVAAVAADGGPDAGDAPSDGLLAPAGVPTPVGVVRLSAPQDPETYARVLYAALREADALGLNRVLAVPPEEEGVGVAVRDRLRRASTPTDLTHRDGLLTQGPPKGP